MPAILEARNISKCYINGKIRVPALKETSLKINSGEISVIVGKSGSGKSTLLNVLGGLIRPDSGRVILNGGSLYEMSEKARANIRSKELGFVYQDFNLIDELSVINNIRLPFDIAGRAYDTAKEDELLKFLGLADRRSFYPKQLSGGERQRTAVARALLMEPSVILADEPTGNLDLESGRRLMDFVVKTNAAKLQTYVIVTHDLEWLKVAHTVYRMSDGVLTEEKQL